MSATMTDRELEIYARTILTLLDTADTIRQRNDALERRGQEALRCEWPKRSARVWGEEQESATDPTCRHCGKPEREHWKTVRERLCDPWTTAFTPGPTYDALRAECERMRAWITARLGPRREHTDACRRFVNCVCGADSHNAAIDAALKGPP